MQWIPEKKCWEGRVQQDLSITATRTLPEAFSGDSAPRSLVDFCFSLKTRGRVQDKDWFWLKLTNSHRLAGGWQSSGRWHTRTPGSRAELAGADRGQPSKMSTDLVSWDEGENCFAVIQNCKVLWLVRYGFFGARWKPWTEKWQQGWASRSSSWRGAAGDYPRTAPCSLGLLSQRLPVGSDRSGRVTRGEERLLQSKRTTSHCLNGILTDKCCLMSLRDLLGKTSWCSHWRAKSFN